MKLTALILLALATAAIAAPPRIIVEVDGERYTLTPETQPATLPVPPPATLPVPPVVTPPVVVAPPVVVPPVVPPALPVRRKMIAPASGPRGDGIRMDQTRHDAAWSLSDAELWGYRQNLDIEGFKGSTSLANVVSVKAWREDPAQAFQGQGLYRSHCGPTTISGCLFGWCGWQADKPAPARTGFRHGLYSNVDCGPLVCEDTIFVGNSGCGAQLRSGGVFRRCVFLDNAINVLAVKGEVLLEDCVIYGAHRYVDIDANGKPRSYSGLCGIYAYTRVTLRNTWIVARQGQDAPDTDAGPLKNYTAGPLGIDRGHRDNPGSEGSYVCEGDCRVIGWTPPSPGYPGAIAATGNAAKDREAARVNALVRPAGVTFGGSAIGYDTAPVIGDVMANRVSMKDGAAKLAAGIRVAAGQR